MKIYKSYKIKNIIKLILFIITLSLMLTLSKQNFNSVKTSVNIFLSSVIPSLFPFILFTEIVLKTDIIYLLSDLFGNIISKIFKVSKNGVSSVIIGFLCGFPMGSKTVNTLYENNSISKKDANILLSFVNNCNPAFILSTIGIGIFNNIDIGIVLLISHLISAILVGIIYSKIYTYKFTNIIQKNRDNCKLEKIQKNKYVFFDILKTSILNSFITLGNILGFIILFNLLSNIITVFLEKINTSEFTINIISGIFEITNGCNNINKLCIDYKVKICIVSFVLGFSGLCILCQVYSTIYKQNFKFKNLIISKTIQGIFSSIITYIILKFTKNNFESISVFKNTETANAELSYYINNIVFSYIISTFAILFIIFIYYMYVKIKTISSPKERKKSY